MNEEKPEKHVQRTDQGIQPKRGKVPGPQKTANGHQSAREPDQKGWGRDILQQQQTQHLRKHPPAALEVQRPAGCHRLETPRNDHSLRGRAGTQKVHVQNQYFQQRHQGNGQTQTGTRQWGQRWAPQAGQVDDQKTLSHQTHLRQTQGHQGG